MSNTRQSSRINASGKPTDKTTNDVSHLDVESKTEENKPSIQDILHMLTKMNATLDSVANGQISLEAKLSNIETKLTKQENDIGDLEKAVNFNADEISDLKSTVSDIDTAIVTQRKEQESIKEQILNMERYSRKYNLRFIGLAEETNGKYEDCIQIIKNLVKTHLGTEVDIENAHRTGKEYPDKPRHIIAKFIRRPQRYQVLNKRGIFKSKGISVVEDLAPADLQRRRELSTYAKEAWEAGKKVRFWNGSDLYIDGVQFKPPPPPP